MLIFAKRTLVVLGFASLTACTDPGDLGLNLRPKDDKISVFFTDSTTITASTEYDDSLISSKTGILLAGSYTDPVFGTSTASFYAHLNYPGENLLIPSDAQLDSVELSLFYKGYYGELGTDKKQTFTVYTLDESFSPDSSYSSKRIFAHTKTAGNITFSPAPSDSVKVNGVNTPPRLIIPLNKDFGSDLFQKFKSGTYNSEAAFYGDFKGIYVEAAPNAGSGSILYFYATSDLSKLTLYYHGSTGKGNIDLKMSGQKVSNVNHFEHTRPGGLIHNNLDSLYFVQAMGGSKVKLHFPGFARNFPSYMAINQAELIIPIKKDADYSNFKNPDRIWLFLADSVSEKKMYIPADLYDGINYYGGNFDPDKGEYHVNIGRYLQNLLKPGAKDYGVYLVAGSSCGDATCFNSRALIADRVILKGPSKGKYPRMRLRLTYSKIH